MTALRPKTVLVMDDSPIVLETVSFVLQSRGVCVKTAANLAELEKHLADGEPDLFVLDVQMPEVFGDDVALVLRDARGSKVPTLLFSSLDEALLAQRARDAGLVGYVSKSAGVEALLAKVIEILGLGAS